MKPTDLLINYINGTWSKPNEKREALAVINPANGTVISSVALSDRSDVEDAAKAARNAFQSWRETPVTKRIQYLFTLKELLEDHLEELAATITNESGKTIHESRAELRRAIENVEVACSAPLLLQGYNNEDIASGIDEIMIRQPIGVAAIIAPFNFPAMIPFWFMPYAIVSGNTCIIKPSERVPNTMNLVFRLMEQLDLPKGVLNLVNGDVNTVDAILEHPEINSISFVGSTKVAKLIYEKASRYGKRVQASGGAKNPVILMPDADPEITTRIVSDSAFGCAGQRCLAASLAITVGEAGKIFRESLSERAASLQVGYGMMEEVEMGPVITRESKSRIESLIETGLSEGARLLVDGRNPQESPLREGYFVKPTLLDGLQPGHTLTRTEIFGPCLSMMHAETIDEAIRIVNSGSYGNMACLFTRDGAAARKFRYEAEAGNIGINIGVAAPMAFFPFGGWNESFFGDLHGQGRDAFEFFTRKKVVVERWPDTWSRKF